MSDPKNKSGEAATKPPYNSRQVALDYLEKHPGRYLFPLGASSKIPFKGTHGHLDASNDPAQIKRWSLQFPGCWWGLAAKKSGIVPVDIDIKPGKEGAATIKALRAEGFEFPPTEKQRSPSGGFHLLYEGEHHFACAGQIGLHVDVPNYVVIAGCGEYTLFDDRAVAPLPEWIAKRIERRADKPRQPTGPAVPLELFQRLAKASGHDGAHGYWDWLGRLMAMHDAAGGEQGDYLSAAFDWSARDPNPTADFASFEEVERKWESFTLGDNMPENGVAITRGSWFKTLTEEDHGDLVGEAISEVAAEDDLAKFAADPVADDEITAVEPDKLHVYPEPMTAGQLASTEFPVQEYTVEDLIMEGWPQTLDGDGGIGKSLVASQMCVNINACVPFFGKAVKQSPVLFVTHEDEDREVKKRMMAQATYIERDFLSLPSLRSISLIGHDMTLAEISDIGKIKYLPFYKVLDRWLADVPGTFCVLDCLTDIVQANLFLRPPPNALYKVVLAELCKKHQASILVLAHPSKTAQADGSMYEGGTANKTALRNKLQMKLADPKDPGGVRLFGTLKWNYGPWSRLMPLIFKNGIFVKPSDGEVAAERHVMHDAVVAEIIKLIKRGIVVVMHTQASGQGPKAIAEAMGDVGNGELSPTPRDVLAIMQAAIRRGELVYINAEHGKRIKAHFEIPASSAPEFADTDE
jgi:hypothetical protein